MLRSLIEHSYCFVWTHKILLKKYRGWLRPRLVNQEWIYLQDDEGGESLLSKLHVILQKPVWQHKTTVLICGDLVNYRLIKHDPRLNDKEHLVLAKHQFQQVYDRQTGERDVFLPKLRYKQNNLSVAVDKEMLKGVVSVFRNSKVSLAQIKPDLVEWLNHVRRLLPKDGWLLIADEPMATILRISDRALSSCSQYRLATFENVKQCLYREALMTGEKLNINSVLYFQIVDGQPVLNNQLTKLAEDMNKTGLVAE